MWAALAILLIIVVPAILAAIGWIYTDSDDPARQQKEDA